MSIVECAPPQRLIIEVAFQKPFVAVNRNEFSLAPEAGNCRVVWSMRGPQLFVMKVMGVFLDMDRLMGRHFERGLAGLKAVAESERPAP
jgi:hypothetical protein